MKFYGKVGYEQTVEMKPGVWVPEYTERPYPMDVYSVSRTIQGTAKVNDDVNLSMVASIIADPYAYENYFSIRYVEYLNSKWRVSSVAVEYPRLKLTLGGLFHAGQSTSST